MGGRTVTKDKDCIALVAVCGEDAIRFAGVRHDRDRYSGGTSRNRSPHSLKTVAPWHHVKLKAIADCDETGLGILVRKR